MSNSSYVYVNIIKPTCMQLLPYIPMQVSPNMITITGGISCCLGYYCMKMADTNPVYYLIVSLLFFIYIVCDNIDGILARDRKQCSKLGKFLDHFVDGTSGTVLMHLIFHRILNNKYLKFEKSIIFGMLVNLLYHFTELCTETTPSNTLIGIEDATLIWATFPILFYMIPHLFEKYHVAIISIFVLFTTILAKPLIVDSVNNVVSKTKCEQPSLLQTSDVSPPGTCESRIQVGNTILHCIVILLYVWFVKYFLSSPQLNGYLAYLALLVFILLLNL